MDTTHIKTNCCPFCGSATILVDHEFRGRSSTPDYYVSCCYCSARGPVRTISDEARKAWNRAKEPDSLSSPERAETEDTTKTIQLHSKQGDTVTAIFDMETLQLISLTQIHKEQDV